MTAVAVGISWVVGAMTGGWRARGIVADIDKKVIDQANIIKDEMRMEHEQMSQRTGEAVQAVRQKITEVELWGRDNFVRHRDFADTIAGINRQFEALSSEVRTGFRDIGNKIDKLKNGN